VKLHTATLRLFGNAAVKISESVIEKRIEIPLDGAVCVKLNKQIIADDWRDVEPPADTLRSRHIVPGDLSAFEARHMPATEAQGYGTGDHQQITLLTPARKSFNATIKRPWTTIGIVGTPVNLIDNAGLRGGRQRWHREIGIATEFTEQSDFSVQSAPFTVRSRIIERPVPVNETKNCTAILLSQKPVVLCESSAIFADFFSKRFAGLALMMEVDLDVSNAETHHLCERIYQITPILLLRIEEGVLRRLTISVAGHIIRNLWPAVTPATDAS
jgi:hypothetical protein